MVGPPTPAARHAPRWGAELTREQVRGHSVLVYGERPRSLADVLDGSRRWGERDYLVDDARRLSFTSFADAVDRVARRFRERDVGAGDRVLLLARNSIEWIVSFWASVRIGAVAALGNAWWAEGQARAACGELEARLVVVDERRAALLAGTPGLLPIAEIGESLQRSSPASPVPAPTPDEDDAAVIVFTSGTTGAPKGAILSHRSVIANQHNFLARTRRLPAQLPDDHPVVSSLLSTPLFHTGGLQALMTALLTGGRLVFLAGRFEPGSVLDVIERERVNVWAGVPTMLQRVLDHPGAADRDLTCLRGLGVGGAPLPDGLLARVPSVFPNARLGVSTNYGSTEAGGIVASGAGQAILDRPGSAGRPLPAVEVKLAGGGAGPGEILVRSAAVFSGYWGDPASPVDEDGWLHTGDLGRLDEDGYLYIVDRLKDIVIRGGENIASPHVENALLSHPAVTTAAIFGLPHADLGEEVAAVVRTARPVTEAELTDHVRPLLAHFEVPTRWWMTSRPFPETATGKVDKRSLRAGWPTTDAPPPAKE